MHSTIAMEFDLSIIIVSWNTCDLTLACVKSIMRHRGADARVQVIVVDNASEDGSPEALRELGEEVELIESRENLGFGRANNIGLNYVRGRLVLFLNSDTEITEGYVPSLLNEFAVHPEVAVFGCKILGKDNLPQHSVRGLPSLRAYLYSDTFFGALGLFRATYERYRRKDFNFDKWQPVDMVMGAALAVRKDVLDEVGGFDPQFFMYYEEVDLCCRIRKSGHRIAYSPVPFIYHIGGASSKKNKARMMFVKRQSMFKYFRKHKPLFMVNIFQIIFKPLFLLGLFGTYLKLSLKHGLALLSKQASRADKYQGQLAVIREFFSSYAGNFLVS